MLQIDDKIISLDLFEKRFICDLDQCAGLCCVHGDSGAPLEEKEVRILQEEYQNFEPYLTEAGKQAVARDGVALHDIDDDLVTPLFSDGAACAYSYTNEKGICLCAIEKAYFDKATTFRKPISCHLYPIRVSKIGDNIALNYDRWSICEPARILGETKGVPVYQFLKEPIIRQYGEAFYLQLEEAAQAWAQTPHSNSTPL